MLDQHHLEQHHRIDTRTPVIFTVERLHHFIQPIKVHGCIDFPQLVRPWHQLVYDHTLYLFSVLFSSFQHLSSPSFILPYILQNAQLLLGFFDKLKRRDGNRHAACLRYAYIS